MEEKEKEEEGCRRILRLRGKGEKMDGKYYSSISAARVDWRWLVSDPRIGSTCRLPQVSNGGYTRRTQGTHVEIIWTMIIEGLDGLWDFPDGS